MVSTRMTWTGGLRFEGQSKFGHPIAIDAALDKGGKASGYSPSELLLFGMIGCTGIDVMAILEKMRQKVTGLTIEVNATQPDDYPKPFTHLELVYHFTGENLDRGKIEQAIQLSQDKYCIVAQTIQRPTKVTYKFDIS